MPLAARASQALVVAGLCLLTSFAHAQGMSPDAGLEAWRQTNARAVAGSFVRSFAPAPARRFSTVSQATELAPGDVPMSEDVPSSDQGELVATPEPEFFDGGEYFQEDGFACGDDCCDECEDADAGFLDGDPSPWYALGDATFLSRSRSPKLIFSRVRQTIIVSGTPIGFDRPVLSTKQVKFDFEPGTRVTLGRNLFRDILDRQHSVEFTYLGLFDWGTNTSIQGTRISNGAIVFGSLLSDVNAGGVDIGGQFLGGYNGADIHRVRSLSDLNNYELNYRLRRLPRRDRIVAGPGGTWMRECTPGVTGSLLTGVRYLSINEQMSFSSQGLVSNLGGPDIADFSAAYRVVTHNDLVGWQLGGDLLAQDCRWALGFNCKAGIYANVANQTSDVQVNNNFFAPSPNSFFKASDVNVAFIGDLGLSALWRVTPRFGLRSSYDFMWVQGLALGPQQIQHNVSNPAIRVNNGSYTVFQGVSLGGEFRW